jgi:hypothetical protein
MGIKRLGGRKVIMSTILDLTQTSRPPPPPTMPSSKPSSPTIPWCCGRDETAIERIILQYYGSNWKKTGLVENVLLKGNWEEGGM